MIMYLYNSANEIVTINVYIQDNKSRLNDVWPKNPKTQNPKPISLLFITLCVSAANGQICSMYTINYVNNGCLYLHLSYYSRTVTVQLSIIRTGNLVGLLRSVISLKPCYTFSENGSVNTNPLCLVVSPVLYTIGL